MGGLSEKAIDSTDYQFGVGLSVLVGLSGVVRKADVTRYSYKPNY